MFRHVLCVYPYRVKPRLAGSFPPLGLELIAAALEPYAKSIDVVDLRHEPRRTADFLRPETDLACFSVNWESQVEFLCEEIRSVPPNVLTVVGGRHATEDPEKWLSDCPNVDILARGDGEEIIEEIAERRPLEKIAGISFRRNGKLVHGPIRHVRPIRDDLWPNRRLRRGGYSITYRGYRTPLTLDCISSSRGCPYNCSFCSFNRNPWGTKRNWTARSPESVVRELEEIDTKIVGFVDDNFTHDMDRVGAICDLIMERGIRKRYIAQARVEIAKRPDVLRKMERAGFSVMLLGLESAQDKTLRAMKKGFNTRQVREYFRVLRKSRMIYQGSFITANIGETAEEMLQIGPYARDLGIDTISMCLLRNMRYSALEDLVVATPGYHVLPDGRIYSDEFPPERIAEIRHRVNSSFYRPRQVLHIIGKAIRNRLLTPSMLAKLPWLIMGKLTRSLRKHLAFRARRRPRPVLPSPPRTPARTAP